MPAASDLKPPVTKIYCPAIVCHHFAIARSTAAALQALADHIARVHGTLVIITQELA